MSNIATKLTYLNGTKQAIKQAINEDFEVIDDNTTFREYADEISSNNAKYKDLIPKETTNATNTLDISNSSGLDKALVTQYGNTYQETTTGKNKLSPNLKPNGDRGIIGTYNNSTGEITITGTPTAAFSNIGDRVDFATPLPIGTYTLSTEKVENVRIGLHLYKSGGDINNYSIALGNKELQITVTDEITGYYLYIYGLDSTKQYNQSFKAMFESGSSATDWEKYTGGNPAPNPDYPQDIHIVSGNNTIKVCGKNLFDVTTIRNAINGSILNNTIISNAISTSYGGVSANITGITLSPGAYYLSLKAKIDSGSASALNKITLVGINNDEVTEIEKPTISSSYQIYVIQITINETKTITNIGVQLGYTNTNAVISYKDIMISKYSDTTYEPYQEQSFDLDLKSKNLFDKDNVIVGKVYNLNGELVNSGQWNTNNDFEKVNENKVSISCKTTGTVNSLLIEFDENKNFIQRQQVNYISSSLTLNTNTKYIRYCYQNTLGMYDIQIEENSTPTDYEPFYDINLCKILDYKDRIYPLNGKWYLEKNIGKVVLNGSENWEKITNNSYYIRTEFGDYSTNINWLISNYFTSVARDNIDSTKNYITISNDGNIRINYLDISSLSQLTVWLSNNNVTVYCIATPTTEEITENNYPTLYNQLNNIKLFEGVNHITMTNKSGLDVEFDTEYYKDWKLD